MLLSVSQFNHLTLPHDVFIEESSMTSIHLTPYKTWEAQQGFEPFSSESKLAASAFNDSVVTVKAIFTCAYTGGAKEDISVILNEKTFDNWLIETGVIEDSPEGIAANSAWLYVIDESRILSDIFPELEGSTTQDKLSSALKILDDMMAI